VVVTTAPHPELAPRRLVLRVDELELLRRLAGEPRLPADFRVVPGQEQEQDGALASLAGRGLVTNDRARAGRFAVRPSLAADLAVLSAPEVLIETRAAVGQGAARLALRAAHAVAGPLGASLVRADEGVGVELSVFPAECLGDEIRRVVPEAGGARRGGSRPAGVVPLAALVELPIADGIGGPAVVAEIAAELKVTSEERDLVLSLAREATGVLQATLTAPARAGGAAWVGEVLWYATDFGWIGLAPEPGAQGRTVARLVPVEPADLPAWLAPLVGQALVEARR
jgi:hypothetical protein